MERKPCPYCGEEISANAKKCRFCGEWLETSTTSDNDQLENQRDSKQIESASENDPTTDYAAYFQDTTGSLFYSGFLSFLIGICAVGAALEIIMAPSVSGSNDRAAMELSNIGDIMSSVLEIVILSLVAHKIYKENLNRSSFFLIVSYACITALATIISLISEETSSIFTIIGLILAIIVGCVLLKETRTKKIGLWLIVSVIGGVIMTLAVIMQSDNINDKVKIFLISLYIIPFGKYLYSCKDYLTSE